MKNNLFEHIILYVIMACVALVLTTLARIFAVSLGFDDFSAFIVFVVVLGVQVVVYLSIHVLLQSWMLPLIERFLMKIPYFKKKSQARLSNYSAVERVEESTLPPTLDEIRNEQLQNIAKQQEQILNIALEYTRKTFAPYVSDEHIELLCDNIKVYSNKLGTDNLSSIRTNEELFTIDLLHFGWNIWNHFRGNKQKQIEIARFLKVVFPKIFKETEAESIKSHLKDDELKGVIKIEEKLA